MQLASMLFNAMLYAMHYKLFFTRISCICRVVDLFSYVMSCIIYCEDGKMLCIIYRSVLE